jgi:hypothetical protein
MRVAERVLGHGGEAKLLGKNRLTLTLFGNMWLCIRPESDAQWLEEIVEALVSINV